MIKSWSAPDAANYQFEHVLAIGIVKDEGTRQMVENATVAQMKKGNGIQSYTVLAEGDLRDKDSAKQKIQKLGFDGAVLVRLLGAEDRVNYVPGVYPAYYGSFWGYYGYSYSALYVPDYVYTDKVFQVETTIYSIKDDKLLWTSLSESKNPKSAEEVMAGIAKAIGKEVRKRSKTKK